MLYFQDSDWLFISFDLSKESSQEEEKNSTLFSNLPNIFIGFCLQLECLHFDVYLY